MQAMLSSLSQIQGVTGGAVFDATGECILHQMPVPYEPILLNQVFSELRTVLDAVRYMDDSGILDSFVCRFDNGYLILREIGGYTVLLLVSPSVNMAMINVGFKVAALKRYRGAELSPAAATPPPAPVHVSSIHVDKESGVGRAPSSPGLMQGTTSALSVSSTLEDAPIPPDAVGAGVVNELVKLLSGHVGPFAKVIFKQELKRIGASTQTLTRSQYDDFVTFLVAKIPDTAGKTQFAAAARRLTTKV